MDTKKLIKDTIANHEGDISPEYEQALKDYAGEQYGHQTGKYNSFDKVLDDITGNMFNGFFRANPAFYGLVRTHVLQMGTAVSGVKNIADAGRLLTFDPEIRKWFGGMETVTQDLRTTAGEERFERQNENNKIAGKVNKPLSDKLDFVGTAGRDNNNHIMLASMLKRANEIYPGRGEEAVRAAMNKTLPKEEALDILVGGMKGLRDATGSGTFAMNRTMLQDMPIAKYMDQLSGYKHVVSRYQSKLAQNIGHGVKTKNPKLIAQSLGSFATLTGATVLLSGHGVINKELEEPLAATIGPERLYAIEHALDLLNAPSYIGINLVDHMQYSLLNYGENAALSNIGQVARDIYYLSKEDPDRTPVEKYTDLLGHILLMTKLSSPLGVGVSTIMRGKQGIYSLAKGETPVKSYSKDWMSPSLHANGRGSMNFDGADFLHKFFLTGPVKDKANWDQKVKFEKYYKKWAPDDDVPYERMEKDYPSPRIDWE
jgi:hypothetical protein